MRTEVSCERKSPTLAQLRARVRLLGNSSSIIRDDQSLSAIFDSDTTSAEGHIDVAEHALRPGLLLRGSGQPGRYSMYTAPAPGSRSRQARSPNASLNLSFTHQSCVEQESVRSGGGTGTGTGDAGARGEAARGVVLNIPSRLSRALQGQVAEHSATPASTLFARPALPTSTSAPQALPRAHAPADTSMASDSSSYLPWPLDEQYRVIHAETQHGPVGVHVGAGLVAEVEEAQEGSERGRRDSTASTTSLASNDTQLLLQGIDSFVRRRRGRKAAAAVVLHGQGTQGLEAVVPEGDTQQPLPAVQQTRQEEGTAVEPSHVPPPSLGPDSGMRLSPSSDLPVPAAAGPIPMPMPVALDALGLPALQPWEVRHGAPAVTQPSHSHSHALAESLDEEECEAATEYAYVPAEDALARARRVLEGIRAARGGGQGGKVQPPPAAAAVAQSSVPSTPAAPFTSTRILLTGGVEAVLTRGGAVPSSPAPALATVETQQPASTGASKLVWRSSPTFLRLLTGASRVGAPCSGVQEPPTPSSSNSSAAPVYAQLQRQASPLKPANLGQAFDKALQDESTGAGCMGVGEPSVVT